jgi:hypothetical protein
MVCDESATTQTGGAERKHSSVQCRIPGTTSRYVEMVERVCELYTDFCSARLIQEELASDLITKGTLSDWFSRDDNAPAVPPLRKRPNPRNIANAAKAEELERELER